LANEELKHMFRWTGLVLVKKRRKDSSEARINSSTRFHMNRITFHWILLPFSGVHFLFAVRYVNIWRERLWMAIGSRYMTCTTQFISTFLGSCSKINQSIDSKRETIPKDYPLRENIFRITNMDL
jgi:hypothetical protein